MRTTIRFCSAAGLMLCLALVTLPGASAGTFKHITIDGSFADWAGVPVAATDPEGDFIAGTLGGFDLKEVYVANDENYLYLRVVIWPSSTNTDYGQFHHHFYIDSDNNPSTGHGVYGLGSEMLIEDAGGYSERYGTFNDGAMTGLDWDEAPSGMLPTLQYEARFSRSVRDVQPADVPVGSGNPARDLPLFTQDFISIAFEVEDSGWAVTDAGSAFLYDLAPKPPAFSGTQTLVDLTSATWRANDSGTDPGPDWLTTFYDDTQVGWTGGTGLFGYNAPAGYPPVSTTLASSRPAYYFRTHFNWDKDQNGVGLLASNYLSCGAVFYLNGAEVKRVRMPDGPVTHSTPATGGPAQPGTAELFDLPAAALIVGDNLLEVEVHPATGATSSLVFGLSLTAGDNFPPGIEDPTQPADRNVTEGQATTFSPGALAGTRPFTYQWLKNGAPIPDATNATLTLDPVTVDDAGQYSVEIANPKGLKATSRAAVLTTTAVAVALTDANLPADQVVAEGTTATFSVSATGSLPAYQWYREGEALTGEVGPQLTLNSVPFTENGKQYWVVVTNRISSATSRHATLTVVRDPTPPAITGVNGGGRRVVVTFTEPLDTVSAQLASNYSLDGAVQVQGAALDPGNGQTVILTTAQQAFGQVYTLAVAGVKDRFGNAMTASVKFRSSILVDGSFDDWNSVPVALTMDQLNPGTVEFQDLAVTNDNDFLYIRFSVFAPVGPLQPANSDNRRAHYDIIVDTDQNTATGTWSGGDVLIEDGDVYRLAGSWTQGTFDGGDVALAPGEIAATNFEFRVSRHAKHSSDGLPAFPNPAVNLFIVLQTMGWVALDETSPQVPYTFVDFTPLPATLSAKPVGSKLEITWPGSGVLETRPSLTTGAWTEVPGASSGIQIDPASAASGYYRLRQ
ncbi:MAG TPA: immunoglobulin domain-containing protein [Verrucomicrobiae bacterium]